MPHVWSAPGNTRQTTGLTMSYTLPSHRYQQACLQGELEADPQQQQALCFLDRIHQELIVRQEKRNSNIGKLRRAIKPRPPIVGLYLWGGVGIGKTHLMDLFYDGLPVQKMRMHFHVFMRELHNRLNAIQGQANPLQIIASDIADNHVVICFDEFFVSNITDAMLLGELFHCLFERGLCLVTTSNIPPDQLYRDGIQRERFLPAIALLQQHTEVMALTTQHDYRLRHLEKTGVYFTPLNQTAQQQLDHCFLHFSHNTPSNSEQITLFGRQLNVVRQANGVIEFEFNELCSPPRSQNDYLAIAEQYHTVIIRNVPQIKATDTHHAILLINLVDVLYDHHTRLIISAATPIDSIYPKGKVTFEFERTESRLIEMNAPDYFAQSD